MKNFTFRFARSSRPLLVLALVALLLSGSLPNRAQAAAGDLDPMFGSGGKVTTDFFGNNDMIQAIALQPDGKIVAAGAANAGYPMTDFALVRYNSNGSLDTTFGTGGKVVTDFFGDINGANAVTLQADGKIVAAGTAFDTSSRNYDFALARYNSDGSLDSMFGSGGKVTTSFLNSLAIIDAIAIQPDNKIVVAGTRVSNQGSGYDFALARYNSNGSLDVTFGTNGLTFTDFFGFRDQALAVVIQPDNKIVAAGETSSNIALARYNPNGSLDFSFGNSGTVVTDFGPGVACVAYDLKLKPDGKLIAAGYESLTPTSADFAIMQYNPDGSLDGTFGSGGKVTSNLSPGNDFAFGIILLPNGKFAVAGNATNGSKTDFVLARYNDDGSLDPTFGAGGKVTTDFFGDNDTARDLVVQPDGRIVVAGETLHGGTGAEFALARYDTSTFDICLQDDSNGNLLLINSLTGSYQFTNCRKNITLTGVGTVKIRFCKIELRASEPGRNLTAMVNSCTHKGSAVVQVFSPDRTYTIDDSDINNNICACR